MSVMFITVPDIKSVFPEVSQGLTALLLSFLRFLKRFLRNVPDINVQDGRKALPLGPNLAIIDIYDINSSLLHFRTLISVISGKSGKPGIPGVFLLKSSEITMLNMSASRRRRVIPARPRE